MRIQNKFVFSFLIFILAACSSPQPTEVIQAVEDVQPTDTIIAPPLTEPPVAATVTEMLVPTNTPAPILGRARYTLDTTIDYDAHTVSVTESILYPNLTGNQLNALVLAVVPNLWVDCFDLAVVAVDGTPTTSYSIDGQRMTIALSSILPAGEVTTIDLQYTLSLPFAEQDDPSVSRPRIFGYTSRQMNLTNWYPFVVPYINGEWVLHKPWLYGEHLVYDAADFEVNLKFTDPANAPTVAASGLPEPGDGFTRYTIQSARTFALSASREFQVSSTQAGDVLVTSYYFPLYEDGGQAALQTTVESLQAFSQHFGPYPHKSLDVVMGDFNDGMEFSGFYYLSRDFYNLYNHTPANYLVFVAAHETAHQWWFDQVASDQAMQPWVDEALCTYAERIYYESLHPDLISWWWTYRIDFYEPEGFVDIPIYESEGYLKYRNAVYFEGAHFLDDLRARIGDDAFYAFIQDYYQQGQGKIVTANDFFRILSQHTGTDYSDIVRQYFKNIYQ